MTQILINGELLEPQPANTDWQIVTTGGKLDGTQTLGGFARFVMNAPPLKTQFFNWKDFENKILTSLTCYVPGEGPEANAITYSNGVVSNKIISYQQPEDRTVRQIRMEILVVI